MMSGRPSRSAQPENGASGRVSVALAMMAGLMLAACGSPESGPMVGIVEATRLQVSAPAAEVLVTVTVDEGAWVSRGDVIFTQDSSRLQAARTTARAQVDLAAARLADVLRGPRAEQILAVRAQRDRARFLLSQAVRDMARAEDLFGRGLGSEDNRDQAVTARDTAATALSEAEARLSEFENGNTAESLQQAKAELTVAESLLAALDVDLDRLTVRAPAAGRIDQVLMDVGELPAVGQTVVILLETDDIYARVYVPAANRLQAAPGVAMKLQLQGQSQPMDGTLRWVSTEAAFTPYFALSQHDRDRLTYPAEVVLNNPPDSLPVGLPVEAWFVEP